MNRSLLKVGQVHRNLRLPANQKPGSLYEAQPAGREADRLGNLLCDLDIRRVQEDVVSDKELARAYHASPSSRMQAGLSKIRLARGIGCNLLTNAFELPAPNIFQVLPLGRSRSRFVQINRNLVTLPYLLADVPRHRDAILNADAVNRNEWHHVRRPQPWVRSLMFCEIN